MWDLGSRGTVVLISVTCGCILVYNAWGAVLALAFTLLLVVYACYSLLTNDSLVSPPHAYRVLEYLREAADEFGAALRFFHGHSISYAHRFWNTISRYYRERLSTSRMDRRRASNYQLSSDSYAATTKRGESSSSSIFNLIDQLTPIPCVPYRSRIKDSLGMDSRLYHAGDYDSTLQGQQPLYSKHTSTPITNTSGREENSRNGDVNLISQSRGISSKKIPPVQNYMPYSRGENFTQFSPEGSPWGMSISPKMRPRPAGVKTVQTVAGPLLASTKYNIDPKVYTDVSSPGLTTRLTKYATEAKNKLTHQSQYSTGQFPKVNLHANPLPLLNAKLRKMRIPVTVRVAPPDVTKYSPPERQKILSNVCHTENRSPTSVVQVLREISLKRHASSEDVTFDVAKKQRTEFFNEEREMILEENKQKRSRDDSKSDEDLSLQNKSLRPAKRTKTRSCYDIINSLSSSAYVASGVKRKAADFSRSGTPDLEKHFKSLESAQSSNLSTIPQIQNIDIDDDESEIKEIYTKKPQVLNSKKTEQVSVVKGILKSTNKEPKACEDKTGPVIQKNVTSTSQAHTIKSVVPKPVKLIDKLFMRAEPERNEQLKSLVEEPSNIRVKFATDDVEEIKKEDIRNMRQNSMKARLQSMFDAISGKETDKRGKERDDKNTNSGVTDELAKNKRGDGSKEKEEGILDESERIITSSQVIESTGDRLEIMLRTMLTEELEIMRMDWRKEMGELREEIKELREDLMRQNEMLKKGMNRIEEIKDEWKEKEIWKRDKDRTDEQIDKLKGKVERLGLDWEENVKKVELKLDRKEGEERIENVIIKDIVVKAENKINPDVVIQADDINIATPLVSHPVSCATLNSSTTTTNINTTPLSTAAIVPSGFSSPRPTAKIETKSDTALVKTTSPIQLNASATNSFKIKETNLSTKISETAEQTKAVLIVPAVTSMESLEKVVSSTPSVAVSTFTFGKSSGIPTVTSNSTLPNFVTGGTFNSNTFTSTSSKSTNFLVDKSPTSSSFAPITPNTTAQDKIETSKITTSIAISSPNTRNTQTTLAVTGNAINFAFGNSKSALSPVKSTQVTVPSLLSQPSKTTLLPVNTITTASIAEFNNITNSSTLNNTTSTITPLFNFGSNSSPLQASKSDNFMFSQSRNNIQVNAFESSTNSGATSLSQGTTKSFNFTPNSSITTIANSSFTTNTTTTTTSTFGLSNASTFSLSTTSATSSISTLSTNKPLFVFGASNSSSTTPIALPATTANNTSGLNTISNNPIATFGPSTTTTVPQFSTLTATTTVSQFGPSTTTVPQFGTPTTSIFATTAITTTNTNMFGTTNNSQTLFGGAPGSGTSEVAGMFNTSTTTVPSIFVSTSNVSTSGSTPSSSLFSNANVNSTPTTTAPSVFGSGTPVFGQTKPSTSFGTTNMFGNATTPFGATTQTGSTPPAFGIAGNVSTSAIASGFNTTNNTTPAFGTPSVGTVTNAQATSAFGSTTGIFGSTDNNTPSVPIFGGSTTPATETFGISSAASTFGTQNPPSLAFGATSSGTFGDNKSLFGATPATTTSFGTSSPSVPAFGANTANNPNTNSTNNMFVFGNDQKDGQQSTTFPFSSNFNAEGSNTAAASTAPFQFGGSSSKSATTGFNFATPSANSTLNFGTTAAPTFNPSTPGMFSIGSGSTAPRSRTIRTRKPR